MNSWEAFVKNHPTLAPITFEGQGTRGPGIKGRLVTPPRGEWQDTSSNGKGSTYTSHVVKPRAVAFTNTITKVNGVSDESGCRSGVQKCHPRLKVSPEEGEWGQLSKRERISYRGSEAELV